MNGSSCQPIFESEKEAMI